MDKKPLKKGASYLQKLWRKTSWILYYRLHPIPTYCTCVDLDLTIEASKAVERYNIAVYELKEELKKSYEYNKTVHNWEKEKQNDRPNRP